jgi:hypothetical protein
LYYNPRTQKNEAGELRVKVSLACTVSPRASWAIREILSQNKQTNKFLKNGISVIRNQS